MRQAWLVVALTGGPSSFDDAADEVLVHGFASRFERVVMLCQGCGSNRRAVALRGMRSPPAALRS